MLSLKFCLFGLTPKGHLPKCLLVGASKEEDLFFVDIVYHCSRKIDQSHSKEVLVVESGTCKLLDGLSKNNGYKLISSPLPPCDSSC